MNGTMKQFEVLHWASSFLKKYNREENVAALLLQHHRQMGRTEFFQNMQEVLPPDVVGAYRRDIEAHAVTGVPVQHLIGSAPFYGEDFFVNEHVLIPRFETEELVAHIAVYLKTIPKREGLIVADIGTGSGVIAITLKRMFPELIVYATDISEQALTIAKKNAVHLGADVNFMQGDFVSPLIERHIQPTIIASNPPYISRRETADLRDTVKNYDPAIALFAEEEGLQAYRMILRQTRKLSPTVLHALFFEIGASQGKDVTAMMKTMYPESIVEVLKDLAGQDRIVVQKRLQV